jgi:hypothetical protein
MTSIAWPDGLAPEEAHIHVRNELVTDVTARAIWPWLLRATRWRELYSNCRGLRFVDERGPDLAIDTRFTWWTFGAKVDTRVTELVPFERLAWTGTGLGARGHHAWLLEERGGETRFVTEETQRGAVPALLAPVLRRGLLHFHQRWLEGLVRAARLGHPDEVERLVR